MKENFYPESEEILFTNREKELEALEFYLEEFLNGIKENICIFGLRRIGKYFERESSSELISKVIECGEESKRLIHQLTGGHPFYIVSIAKRTKLIHRIYDLSINPTTIKRAFLIETLYPEGGVYKHCSYLLNTVLSLAKYKAPLIGILNTLLREDGLTQSKIAKRIKVSQGEARLYTSELERLDILQRIEDRYYIEDKVFKMWLDLRKNGELGESPKDKPVEIYLRTLERKYLKAKTELGKAKESEIREKISKSGLINMLASVSIVICTHRSERCEDLVEALQQAGKFCRNG